MGQVMHNQESQRRQYGLAERASELGFRDVMVIDEDLGRSGSGMVERPGFQRLVGEVCTGEVGAVFCVEASRLARNGRDWHHLIELCGMTGVVVVDPDGIYDPAVINDRLLLNRPDSQSTYYSTSGHIGCVRPVFRLRYGTWLAFEPPVPPADITHVLRGEVSTESTTQTRTIE
jgi:hypothetical protein